MPWLGEAGKSSYEGCMKLYWGLSDYALNKQNREERIEWDTQKLINPHILLCGKSGTGKTFRLRKMIAELARQDVQFHVFDVHGDIHIPGESRVLFSESSRFGYNPLVLNPDPHVGGVRRAVNGFISTINRTSHALGARQVAALRSLLLDTYHFRNCYEDNPASWAKREITETERKALRQAKRYDDLRAYYPTIDDLILIAERRLRALYIGMDLNANGNRCLAAIDETNRTITQLKRTAARAQAATSSDEQRRLENQVEIAKQKAMDSFRDFIGLIETGTELEDATKFDSKETLKSVVDRLKNLAAIGIFHPHTPPFDPRSPVWVYDIKSLPPDEQLLFVFFRMEQIFRERLRQGSVNELQEVIVADEAHKFFSDEPGNPFDIIVREGRKFGLALWCASQSPTHFSEDFITTVATKVLLGIDTYYWKSSCTQLRIEEDVLRYIVPHKTAAVYMDRKGGLNAKFSRVQLPEYRGDSESAARVATG
jgi:hypothetical protein